MGWRRPTWRRSEGDPSAAALRRLAEGVELEDGPTAAAGVRRLATATIELVIHEGRNRQVRRMLEAVGHPVRSLHRSATAGIELGDLPSGGWRGFRLASWSGLDVHDALVKRSTVEKTTWIMSLVLGR